MRNPQMTRLEGFTRFGRPKRPIFLGYAECRFPRFCNCPGNSPLKSRWSNSCPK
jgi:hypothetical protein